MEAWPNKAELVDRDAYLTNKKIQDISMRHIIRVEQKAIKTKQDNTERQTNKQETS